MMRIDAVQDLLRGHGAREPHVVHLLRQWIETKPLGSGERKPADFLPLRLRQALPDLQRSLDDIVRVSSCHPARDGSTRLLMALADGQSVETVLLPREGVCVSTQVGCAVGCVFCMTGREGLLRQVGSAEIVAQVIAARARAPVRKVVFMGMGEPAHNLDNVLEAIDLLGTLGGIGHKSLVFSTVGDARVFDRLPAQRVKPALALSLHTTRADLRETLLPRAPRITPDDLVAQAQAYARITGYPVQYQWTLIDGVNDGLDEVEGIARLLAGQYAVMNLIPYNAVEGLAYARPSNEQAITMVRMLRERGVLATLRQSAGQDVDAGCGQLRARTIPIVAA
jgi:23S rRNA (adenine2503-C2)-methyltransferase